MSDLIKVAEVECMTSLNKKMISRMLASGHFPKPSSMQGRSNLFSKREIEQWLCDKLGGVPHSGALKLLNIKQVLDLLTVSSHTLYKLIKTADFPCPIKLSASLVSPQRRTSYWPLHLVMQWMNGRSQTYCRTALLASDELISMNEVTALTGMSRDRIRTIYEGGQFPLPLRLGSKRINRWVKRQVDAYVRLGRFWATDDNVFIQCNEAA